ncbi:unnamed protein product [Lymnaea stagnalis]|uniref:Uncharacterized protein n=1 Tax=Lymnaea stagnalis TaxID=6523 RepID=A0AAV2HMR8_LYMST
MPLKSRQFGAVSVLIIFVGTVLHIVGVATPEWTTVKDENGKTVISQGLWTGGQETRGQETPWTGGQETRGQETPMDGRPRDPRPRDPLDGRPRDPRPRDPWTGGFDDTSDALKACGACCVLAIIGSVAGMILAALYHLSPALGVSETIMFSQVSLASTLASAALIIITFIIWLTKVVDHTHSFNYGPFIALGLSAGTGIGYSFILSIFGCIFIGLGGGLGFVGAQRFSD